MKKKNQKQPTPQTEQTPSQNSLATFDHEELQELLKGKRMSDSEKMRIIDDYFLSHGFTDSTEEMLGKTAIHSKKPSNKLKEVKKKPVDRNNPEDQQAIWRFMNYSSDQKPPIS